MNKIILFGGAGFIGSHFKKFLNRDYKVFSVDIHPSEGDSFCDVREKINYENENFSKDDILINLAAVHRMPGHADEEYFEANIKGAENVCEFAEEKGINNIIFTSSIAPYGASEELKTEDTLPTPNTPYGISKLVAEHIHRTWQAKDKNRKLLIIRPGVVYGKGENGNNTRLYKALDSGKFFYPGRKDTVKANIYVKDLVQLVWQIFDSYTSGVKLYNFAYEPAYSIEQIVETMCDVVGRRKPKIVLSGTLLIAIASFLSKFGLGKLGIHPERIKKLMISTNISGKKIIDDGFKFNYTLKQSIEDWYKDCDYKGLF